MERINYQRNSMRIFWSREKGNHIENPKIDQIYEKYKEWFENNKGLINSLSSKCKRKGNVIISEVVNQDYPPINKYLFRTYIRKNGYKNAQPKKKKVEKEKKKVETEKPKDYNLLIPEEITNQYDVVDNQWVIVIKTPHLYKNNEIKGKRVCLFRGKFKEDWYGVVNSLHFVESYQRIIPIFKDKITDELLYFYPDQLCVIVEDNVNLSQVLKDFLIADIKNSNTYFIWIKPSVSLYYEINRISQINGIKEVNMIKIV